MRISHSSTIICFAACRTLLSTIFWPPYIMILPLWYTAYNSHSSLITDKLNRIWKILGMPWMTLFANLPENLMINFYEPLLWYADDTLTWQGHFERAMQCRIFSISEFDVLNVKIIMIRYLKIARWKSPHQKSPTKMWPGLFITSIEYNN